MLRIFRPAPPRSVGLDRSLLDDHRSSRFTLAPFRVRFPSFLLERMRGIEPPSPAWEAGVLPLNHIRVWKSRCPRDFYIIPKFAGFVNLGFPNYLNWSAPRLASFSEKKLFISSLLSPWQGSFCRLPRKQRQLIPAALLPEVR